MSTWYKTTIIEFGIHPVEVVEDLGRFVMVQLTATVSKYAKTSEICQFHETFEDAFNFLEQRAIDRRATARSELTNAMEELEKIRSLKP